LVCFELFKKIVFILIKLGVYTMVFLANKFLLNGIYTKKWRKTTHQTAPDGDEGTTARD
jgi:hypothetical protein